MPDFLNGAAAAAPDRIGVIVLRLVVSMVFGAAIAFLYRRTRRMPASSFTITLVLLAILIAMVTQVIGDNVARAFSLVGALSIVRFRTVVRDTQDTAYVIAAVALGMAVGAGHFGVAVAGFGMLSVAAFAMMPHVAGDGAAVAEDLPYSLTVRLGLGIDAAATVGPRLEGHASAWRLIGATTTRQGLSIDVSYRLALKDAERAQDLVAALNGTDGVQSVDVSLVVGRDDG
jgi:hypothetical protein